MSTLSKSKDSGSAQVRMETVVFYQNAFANQFFQSLETMLGIWNPADYRREEASLNTSLLLAYGILRLLGANMFLPTKMRRTQETPIIARMTGVSSQ
jgi:hypothetical protein